MPKLGNGQEYSWTEEIPWEEGYYESRKVNRGRKSKYCCVCGKTIQVGDPSHTHTFYPEFDGYHTHDAHPEHGDSLPEGEKSCTEIFMEEARKPVYGGA